MKISIIGAGNMGSAIARGLSAQAVELIVSNPHTSKLEALKADIPNVKTTTDNVACVKGADLVVLAIKPYMLEPVLDEIVDVLDLENVIIASLIAPVSLDDLAKIIVHAKDGDGVKTQLSCPHLLKIIPNTAISVGQSMTFISQNNVADDKLEEVVKLFKAMGDVDVVPERLMGACTALCSCGIAYAMRYIRAAVEGAVELGIRPVDALRYEIETLKGACALLESSGAHPEAEIDKVTTPGGITIKGLNMMERFGFTTAVIEGLKASK